MNDGVLNFVKAAGLEGRIVDVGSFNVNGAVRDVLKIECGIDMRPGPGVDKVMMIEDMHEHFSDLDALTCCDTMEHVENWRDALTSMWKSLKVGGKLVLTVPHASKGFHGYPSDYWRWTPLQLIEIFKDQRVVHVDHKVGVSHGVIVQKLSENLSLSDNPTSVKDKKGIQELLAEAEREMAAQEARLEEKRARAGK